MSSPDFASKPTVARAIDLLIDNKVIQWHAPRSSRRHILGIVTEFALLSLVYDSSVETDSVSQHMTKEAISVTVLQLWEQNADLFILHRIRRVLVENAGKLVGLIGPRHDLPRLGKSARRDFRSPIRRVMRRQLQMPSNGRCHTSQGRTGLSNIKPALASRTAFGRPRVDFVSRFPKEQRSDRRCRKKRRRPTPRLGQQMVETCLGRWQPWAFSNATFSFMLTMNQGSSFGAVAVGRPAAISRYCSGKLSSQGPAQNDSNDKG